MELKSTQARDLDTFIENLLLPDAQFRKQVKQAIHIISTFLKERCFQNSLEPVRVSKVVKGGSSGKGTTLRGRSDADLVVFLNNFTSYGEQFNRRAEFIQEIRRQLEACQRERSFEVMFHINEFENPRALSFRLSQHPSLLNSGEFVEFDILPAYDALGQWNKSQISPQIYIKLINEGKEGEFSSCFTEVQRSFLKGRPTKLKSLIRLVKHWFQECREDLGKPLPQQYALELLTVYAWEEGCKETYFNTAQGFRTVLDLVLKYKQLCIFWEKYYDFTDPFIKQYLKSQLNKPRPVILDPADPTGNVAGGNEYGWERLAQEARTWLYYPCFKNWDGSTVEPWHVSVSHSSLPCTLHPICKFGIYFSFPKIVSCGPRGLGLFH
ncbi:2'-5'-oligoadenylate synthase 1 [Suncus etruscus]|uniref:2'-5'-oligoadenylate synthase 1 n=1 Tax=Suncus etruscus TaxID=109475 RepID=UPI00210F29D4|nr:2'-5'-oligoadenylate synthase 1 [Suncus etruscus]